MSTRNDYSADEWTTLLLGPLEARAAILYVGKSGFRKNGFIGTAQELLALHNATSKEVAQKYAGNELVQSLLASDTKAVYGPILKRVEAYVKDETARTQMRAEAMQMGQRIATILEQAASFAARRKALSRRGEVVWPVSVCLPRSTREGWGRPELCVFPMVFILLASCTTMNGRIKPEVNQIQVYYVNAFA